jgi:N-methylhydantoinase B/oxoprolinase/acetone carboxylase alpha subunit
VDDPRAQLAACHRALHQEAELVRRHDEASFVELMRARIAAEAPEVADTIAQAVPYDHIHKGLSRWWSKRAG